MTRPPNRDAYDCSSPLSLVMSLVNACDGLSRRTRWRIVALALLATWILVHVTLVSSWGSETIRVEVARDTWLSNYSTENNGSNGAAPRLKLKSIQELSLIDFQPGPLRGRSIEKVTLFLKVAGDEPIERVTVSTITCDWVEGKGTSYQVIPGVSSFSHRVYPNERWNDSDLTAVCIGHGGSIYASVDAKPSSQKGWVELDIPPRLLEARMAGLSYGLVLMDDTGSTWTRKGDEFQQKIFPNRFVYSRDSNASSAPYFMVDVATPDAQASSSRIPKPSELRFEDTSDSDPRPRMVWRFDKPTDSQALGFRVTCNDDPIPQYFVPSIDSARKGWFTMPIDQILARLQKGQKFDFTLRAVDRFGRTSDPAILSASPKSIDMSPIALEPVATADTKLSDNANWKDALEWHGAHWSVIDPLDTYLPVSKKWIPKQRPSYFSQNHLWNAPTKTVQLDAARGSWVGFQVVCDQPQSDLVLQWSIQSSNDQLGAQGIENSTGASGQSPAGMQQIRSELSRYALVAKEKEQIPDPLVLLTTGNTQFEWSTKSESAAVASGNTHSWLVECYVPTSLSAGTYPAKLRLSSGKASLEIDVAMNVHDVVVPNELSFLPEMNCYDLPQNDIDYYRLGHRHRTIVNRVPYFQNGRLADGCSPVWKDGAFDWDAFDRRYEGCFTGAAFADLPRGPVPLECFYFAMHENWPSPMETNYNGSYWADQAFPDTYREAWVSAVAQSAGHVSAKGWNRTKFHVFLNNKLDFKKRGWSRGSSPWLLDEPANFQDYLALRYYGLAYLDGIERAGIAQVNPQPHILYRCDVSRPQWQRDTLDGIQGYSVISQGAFREYRYQVLDRKFLDEQVLVLYGGNNPVGTNNAMAVAWSWDAWCQGADGVLPWQTIGRSESWKSADELSLFYPHPTDPKQPPMPSIRLKAYCYGQQDVEILAALAKKFSQDRYAFGARAQSALKLKPESRVEGDYAEPATWNDYGNMTPETLHRWRVQWLRLASSTLPTAQ